jgi:glycerol-3-phosphate dehydrogenase (NAD(P)+)
VDHDRLHERVRTRRANPLVYGIVRVSFQLFFLIYFRMQRIGREHIPKRGPVIIAANHRSFLDPFVIACMARRPMYYVAKQEIFVGRVISWLLTSLGAFPVMRGASDADTIITAKAILARGDIVLIFPEGTRTRPGSLGAPRRGVGRLALETGAPVVPLAVIGTEAVRKGVLIRPHRVRMRAGRALRFPIVDQPSPALAGAVTDRIWPCVMLQWEWLGGLAPIRRIAVIGAGAWGTALAVLLTRAGFEVELGCRTKEQADTLAQACVNDRYLPGVQLPDQLRVLRASELNLEGHDLVCLAVPATALPAVLAAHGGQISRRLGVLVAGTGLVAPLGTLPATFAAARCAARAVAVLGGPVRADGVLDHGGSIVLASRDRGFGKQLRDMLRTAKLDVTVSSDVVGVQFAGCATDVAAFAAEAASTQGADIAGAAAGKVFAEVDSLARVNGSKPETFGGLAGVGNLVTTVAGAGSSERRGGELPGAPRSISDIGLSLDRPTEAVETIALLAGLAREARIDAPALEGLAALVEGRIEPAQWQTAISEPGAGGRRRARAA